MPYFIVLDEQQLPKGYDSLEEAREEGGRLAGEFEDEHGRPAEWFIVSGERVN
jgi:hypothetical protein